MEKAVRVKKMTLLNDYKKINRKNIISVMENLPINICLIWQIPWAKNNYRIFIRGEKNIEKIQKIWNLRLFHKYGDSACFKLESDRGWEVVKRITEGLLPIQD